MPKRCVDYSKTMIYKLVCNDPNIFNIYVGSTTNWVTRKAKHKFVCNNPSSEGHNQKKYRIIRLNGGWSNWSMVLLEYYPCNNYCEAEAREYYYTQLLNSDMNTYIPGAVSRIGLEEYCRRYSIEYRKKNKLQIQRRLNTKYSCACGGSYTYVNKTPHYRTEKHQKFLNQIQYEYFWDDGTPCTEQEYYQYCH